jgi:general secretion pathway protein B
VSFILDALRKSEHERERKQLPGLADAPVARPVPSKLPWLLAGIGALLAVNLVALVVLLFRGGDERPPHEAPAAPSPPAAFGSAPAGPATAFSDPATPAAADTTREVRPLAVEAAAGAQDSDYDYVEPPPVDGGPRVERLSPGEPRLGTPRAGMAAEAVTAPVPGDGRIGLATPPRAAVAAPRAGTFPPRADSVPGLPRLDDLSPQATAGLPTLNLNLHVYSNEPAQRFVVLNGERYREGSRLAAGPALERITPEGVVLNHDGLRFLLPRD